MILLLSVFFGLEIKEDVKYYIRLTSDLDLKFTLNGGTVRFVNNEYLDEPEKKRINSIEVFKFVKNSKKPNTYLIQHEDRYILRKKGDNAIVGTKSSDVPEVIWEIKTNDKSIRLKQDKYCVTRAGSDDRVRSPMRSYYVKAKVCGNPSLQEVILEEELKPVEVKPEEEKPAEEKQEETKPEEAKPVEEKKEDVPPVQEEVNKTESSEPEPSPAKEEEKEESKFELPELRPSPKANYPELANKKEEDVKDKEKVELSVEGQGVIDEDSHDCPLSHAKVIKEK